MANHQDTFAWPKALRLAVALGIVWGGAMLLTGIVATYTTQYAHAMVDVFASIYFGYGPGWGGAFLGLLWGFADVFLGTIIAVALYNAIGRTWCPSGQDQPSPQR